MEHKATRVGAMLLTRLTLCFNRTLYIARFQYSTPQKDSERHSRRDGL